MEHEHNQRSTNGEHGTGPLPGSPCRRSRGPGRPLGRPRVPDPHEVPHDGRRRDGRRHDRRHPRPGHRVRRRGLGAGGGLALGRRRPVLGLQGGLHHEPLRDRPEPRGQPPRLPAQPRQGTARDLEPVRAPRLPGEVLGRIGRVRLPVPRRRVRQPRPRHRRPATASARPLRREDRRRPRPHGPVRGRHGPWTAS